MSEAGEIPPKPRVSEIPLTSVRPKQSRFVVSLLVVFFFSAVACASWIVYDLTRVPVRYGEGEPPDINQDEPPRSREKHSSLARMQRLAEALLSYRNQVGGGLRWPSGLSELEEVGLLPVDFDFRGPLSDRPIVYSPHMPPSHDPALWVLAHDRLYGRRAGGRGMGRYVNGVVGAVVIFGDGSVRYLDEKEVTQYGGLSDPAAR
jgi:hypothetical protein